METDQQRGRLRLRRSAVILGTNEIASAVAVALRRNDYDVILSHDPSPPVIRRKMAFHDALFGDPVVLSGIGAERVDSGIVLRGRLGRADGVIITELGLLDLIVIQAIDLLVDARLQKYAAKPDLRRLARSTIGLGPGFVGGRNCDIAVETRPGVAGRIIEQGATDEPDGIPGLLGEVAAERFVRADINGRWHTAVEIGTRVYRDFIIGHLGNIPVPAPFDGLLRGVVRDDTEVLAGSKLLEIDPRGRAASATEIDDRVKQIAAAVIRSLTLREEGLSERPGRKIHLVK
jgi:hypothetical protein